MPVSPRARVLAAAAAAATGITLGVAGTAYASDDSEAKTCADFVDLKAAQVALDVDKLLALDIELGGVANGIACDLPRTHPGDDSDDDADDPSCDDFDSQADAQSALDDDEDLAEFIDRDGDGVACESLLDDDDESNDDDDGGDHHDDGDDHGKKDKDNDKDKADSDGGDQVKVYPSGGVDTGGAA